VIVLATKDAEVHLHALQTTIEQLELCEWGHFLLGKLQRFSEHLHYGMHLITQRVHLPPCSNSAMKGDNGTNCTTILLRDPSQNLPRLSLPEPGIPDCRLLWVLWKRKLFLM
jgi:hypothetical protein